MNQAMQTTNSLRVVFIQSMFIQLMSDTSISRRICWFAAILYTNNSYLIKDVAVSLIIVFIQFMGVCMCCLIIYIREEIKKKN